ncbi:MAG: hypothetical protein K2M78_10180 [Lachnospiraceae bacterium]|nr:hypothetical protein [Lachnospiraceae bacterium]
MKVVRIIILFFALVLGFVLQTEIFQSELWNFDGAYYLIMQYDVEEDKMNTFLEDVYTEAENNNVSVFSTNVSVKTKHNSVLNIYGDSDVIKEDLKKVMGIEEQTYSSLLNGSTRVEYKDFFELALHENNTKKSISFIGDEADIINVYKAIADKYDVSYPEYFQATEEDMVIIVWSMIAFLIIAMSCIEVLRRKKEVVIRISLGESAAGMIAKSVLKDIIQYAVVYILARSFVFYYISGEYAEKVALGIYIIGVIVSLLPYIAFARYDVRKAFHNVSDSKEVLYTLYFVKFVVTALAIFTITTNLGSIHWNMVSDDELIEQYKECSYITLANTDYDDRNEELFWNKIYEEEYEVVNPVICVNVLEDKNDYILVNNNAGGMLQGFKEKISQVVTESDITIFLPTGSKPAECEKTAIEWLDSFLENDSNKLNIQVVKYDERQVFSYMSSGDNYGISTAINPVIIYQNNEKVQFSGYNLVRYAGNEIIYRIENKDLEKIKREYDEYIKGCDLVVTNVYDSYEYQKSFIRKLISFLSSLCVVVFILDIAVVFSITSLEYKTHSMEISIAKVLGYSLYERNKKIILYNIISDGIILAVMCVVGLITKILNAKICMAVGILVLLIEMFIMIFNIIKVENQNIYKILKGGCL